MSEVTMPRLSDTMEEGTITRWLKKSGDQVKKGDILAEVETDKANMEIESFENGILEQIIVKEGETAPIGQPIALIGSGQGARPAAATASQAAPAAPSTQSAPSPVGINHQLVSASAQQASVNGQQETRVKASPLARRIAEEHGIDLRQVQGTGPGGRIVRDDLTSHIEQRTATPVAAATTTTSTPQPAAPAQAQAAPATQVPLGISTQEAEDEVITLSQMQKTVARRLLESKQNVPHFYVRTEIDMTDALALRKVLNTSESGVKVSVNDMVVKAVALALEKFPEVNSSWKDSQIIRHKHINVGIAVDVPNGLVVPVVRDANIKGVRAIAREARALIEKARNNKLSLNDFTGGTFSVSNLGMMDVSDFTAIINPPEAAILAIASSRQVFVPVDGQPVLRDIMPITCSADHRVLYGAGVARFLQEVKRLLQNPYELLG